jgi:hypothetical protein
MTKKKLAKITRRACFAAVAASVLASVYIIWSLVRFVLRDSPIVFLAVFGIVALYAGGAIGFAWLEVWARDNSEDPPTPHEILEATLDAFAKKT